MKPSSSAAPSDRRARVQSAGTAVTVLKGLSDIGGSASLTALAAHLNESPAKVHRYLVSLIEGDLVVQDPVTARYVLGVGSILIGLAAMRQSDVLTLAAGELSRLAEQGSP